MKVAPCEIAVIQRGIKFSVDFEQAPNSHPDPTQRESTYAHAHTLFILNKSIDFFISLSTCVTLYVAKMKNAVYGFACVILSCPSPPSCLILQKNQHVRADVVEVIF